LGSKAQTGRSPQSLEAADSRLPRQGRTWRTTTVSESPWRARGRGLYHPTPISRARDSCRGRRYESVPRTGDTAMPSLRGPASFGGTLRSGDTSDRECPSQARLAPRCGTAARASEGVAACASCSPRSPASGISLPWPPWRETLVGGGHHVAVATAESFSETVQAAGLAHIAAGLGNAVAAEGVRPPTRRYGRSRLRRWSGGRSSRCS
jgi:hypothetical protein